MHMQQSDIHRNCVLWIVRGSEAVCICSKVLKFNHKIHEIRIVGNTTVFSCMHLQQGVIVKFVL
jgi:hypothetical protein